MSNHKDLKFMLRCAGSLYLIIFISAGFSYGFIQAEILVQGDALATAQNILLKKGMLRASLFAGLIGLLCDIGLAVLLFILFKPVHYLASLGAASFRIVQTAILGVGSVLVIGAMATANQPQYSDVLSAGGTSPVMMLLDLHNTVYDVAMTFFGVSCIFIGYLLYKSQDFKLFLGVLMMAAGISYLTDSFTNFLLPEFAVYTEWFVVLTAVIGELAFAITLLLKGIRSGD